MNLNEEQKDKWIRRLNYLLQVVGAAELYLVPIDCAASSGEKLKSKPRRGGIFDPTGCAVTYLLAGGNNSEELCQSYTG
jgi:hypothetical protein